MLSRQPILFLQSIAVMAAFMLYLMPTKAQAITLPQDASSAVFFVYHMVGDETSAQGGISSELFASHIQELKSGEYNVMALPAVIEAIKAGKELPPQTVVITFDGAWQSTLKNALPLLDEAQLPYTVFFASDLADQSDARHMTWRQIRQLAAKKNVTLGILPASYAHIMLWSERERAAVINRAVARYREELGAAPKYFAYAFGEYSTDLKKQVTTYGFDAAFAQQSGVAYAGQDMMTLPRFTMTESFGDLDRFRMTASALPMPVSDIVPENPLILETDVGKPPMLGFTVTPELKDLSRLSCFASGNGKLPVTRLGNNRVEIRFAEALSDRRTRINCTITDDPSKSVDSQRWRWFGFQLLLPEDVPNDEELTDDNTETETEQTSTSTP